MIFNWIKSKFTHLSMIIILIISIAGLFIIEKTKTLAPDSAYSTKVQAAQIMIISLNRSFSHYTQESSGIFGKPWGSQRTFNTSTFENRPKPYHLPGLVIFYF